MKKTTYPVLFWASRGMVILLAIFISLFALDVFGEGYDFWQTLLALFMHLLPTFTVLLALAIAWRWERIGGILFIGLGACYIIGFSGRFNWSIYLIIAGPLFLAGLLFLVSSKVKARQ